MVRFENYSNTDIKNTVTDFKAYLSENMVP